MRKQKLVVILGPTASGKSALGVWLAKKFNGEIISADSRQVYRGLDFASGKISKKEKAGILHHCLDIASLRTRHTAVQWKKCAESALRKIKKRRKLPIIVGGTAFYISALVYKDFIPQVKPNWKLRKELEKKASTELFKMLKKLDQRRARTIEKDNPRRLIRAIEIIKQTGRPVPEFKPELRDDFGILILGIRRSDKDLQERIKGRLKNRLAKGMIREIRNLRSQKISWRRLEELGLEPRWIARFLQNKISKKEMAAGIIKDTIKFARRQMSWWKKVEQIRWIRSPKAAENIINNFINLS